MKLYTKIGLCIAGGVAMAAFGHSGRTPEPPKHPMTAHEQELSDWMVKAGNERMWQDAINRMYPGK